MKIGIAGIGGIGSNVARHLAQAGVLSVKIVDFDCVEISNLNRQFYTTAQVGRKKTQCLEENLHAIFPGMEIEAVDKKIKPGDAERLFRDCSIVVEGFDQKHLKKNAHRRIVGYRAETGICLGHCRAGYDRCHHPQNRQLPCGGGSDIRPGRPCAFPTENRPGGRHHGCSCLDCCKGGKP